MAASRQFALWAVAAALCLGFVALGSWQLQRLAWKRALIAQVEARLQAEPVAPPDYAPGEPVPREDEYRRLRLVGRYRTADEVLVQAVTARGPGWWLIVPLQLGDGRVVLVNRGFVDAAHRAPASRVDAAPGADVSLVALLRRSEPRGGFLRRNDPASGRWHSRDVEAIGQALALDPARLVPYFVDAEARADDPAWPVAGLTVVRFPNSHLVYALTWYTLAAMSVVGGWIATRQRSR